MSARDPLADAPRRVELEAAWKLLADAGVQAVADISMSCLQDIVNGSPHYSDAERRMAAGLIEVRGTAAGLAAALRDLLPWAKGSHDGAKTCDCDRCENVHAAEGALAKVEARS